MEFITSNYAPVMFGGLIIFLLLGFPVAFSWAPAACCSASWGSSWGSFLRP